MSKRKFWPRRTSTSVCRHDQKKFSGISWFWRSTNPADPSRRCQYMSPMVGRTRLDTLSPRKQGWSWQLSLHLWRYMSFFQCGHILVNVAILLSMWPYFFQFSHFLFQYCHFFFYIAIFLSMLPFSFHSLPRLQKLHLRWSLLQVQVRKRLTLLCDRHHHHLQR